MYKLMTKVVEMSVPAELFYHNCELLYLALGQSACRLLLGETDLDIINFERVAQIPQKRVIISWKGKVSSLINLKKKQEQFRNGS